MELSWLGGALTATGAMAGGAFTWLAARHKGKADMLGSQAAMIKAAQDAATEVIATLQGEITVLRTRIDALEAQLRAERAARRQERRELADRAMRAEARAGLAERRAQEAETGRSASDGQVRALQQQLDSLQRQLRAEGSNPSPSPPQRPCLHGSPP